VEQLKSPTIAAPLASPKFVSKKALTVRDALGLAMAEEI